MQATNVRPYSWRVTLLILAVGLGYILEFILLLSSVAYISCLWLYALLSGPVVVLFLRPIYYPVVVLFQIE